MDFSENNEILFRIDNQIELLLNYTDLQSRSIVLDWQVTKNYFNYFIIYYRHYHEQDFKQIRTIDYSSKFQVNDLIPYTTYEFRIKGFINGISSNYSNSVIIKTTETIPEKIENLHGYVWNETAVVVHWTPPNSTNGPNFVSTDRYSPPIFVSEDQIKPQSNPKLTLYLAFF